MTLASVFGGQISNVERRKLTDTGDNIIKCSFVDDRDDSG